jgi:hypothetical protein
MPSIPKEESMNALLPNTSTSPRNPYPRELRLERLSPALRRQLGDVPALIWQADRAQSWLGAAIMPPTVRIEAGREVETLSSAVIAALLRLRVPVIFVFEGGWRKVTRFAGASLQSEARP